MSDLNDDLEQLKAEIEQVRRGAGDPDELAELIDRVDRKIEEGHDHDDEGLVEHLEEALTRYEASHPRLTNVVSRLIDTLSAAGL